MVFYRFSCSFKWLKPWCYCWTGPWSAAPHKVHWLQAAESGNACVNREVLDPDESRVGRTGSVAWGRRPGRGCEEERAPHSWKASCKEALPVAGGGSKRRQGACFERGSLQDRRCTSKRKHAGWAGFGFALGSNSGIKHIFGLAMPHPCSLLETPCFSVKWSWLSYPLRTSPTKLLLLPTSMTQPLQAIHFSVTTEHLIWAK